MGDIKVKDLVVEKYVDQMISTPDNQEKEQASKAMDRLKSLEFHMVDGNHFQHFMKSGWIFGVVQEDVYDMFYVANRSQQGATYLFKSDEESFEKLNHLIDKLLNMAVIETFEANS